MNFKKYKYSQRKFMSPQHGPVHLSQQCVQQQTPPHLSGSKNPYCLSPGTSAKHLPAPGTDDISPGRLRAGS